VHLRGTLLPIQSLNQCSNMINAMIAMLYEMLCCATNVKRIRLGNNMYSKLNHSSFSTSCKSPPSLGQRYHPKVTNPTASTSTKIVNPHPYPTFSIVPTKSSYPSTPDLTVYLYTSGAGGGFELELKCR
jgi:hypothetical protein